MGIKNFHCLFRKKLQDDYHEYKLSELEGMTLAIDTSIFFYRFLYKHPRFIEQFLEQIYKLIQSGITPIYIFDGKPPKEKQNELNDRKERKNEMKDKMKELQKELGNIIKTEIIEETDSQDESIDI